MEEFLNSDLALVIFGALAGVVGTVITQGAAKLAKSFKESSNKWDDLFVPLLEDIAAIKATVQK